MSELDDFAREPDVTEPPPAGTLLRQVLSQALAGPSAMALTRTRLPVVFLGETGTGKSTMARLLHQRLNPDAPFVDVNAASLSAPLFCSEMFGHARGSFTGAHAAKPGLVELARGGTLFLDEVGDLSLEAQAHLLSFLDTGTFRAVGGVREHRSDARIFAATNRDMERAVRDGRFREDLYYRLVSVVVAIPPLRESPTEIIPIAQDLLRRVSAAYGVAPPRLLDDAASALTEQDWPGNVRQLRFLMERIVVTWPGQPVGLAALRTVLPSLDRRRRAEAAHAGVQSLAEVERLAILKALDSTSWNRTKAARILGITPRGLYNKLRRYGVSGSDGQASDLPRRVA